MDADLARIEKKVDGIARVQQEQQADLLLRFHGKRGDNGIYGRLQSLEDSRANARWHFSMVWTGLLAAISGIWASLVKH